MAVTLQIVGLYYKYDLKIPFDSGPKITVKDVLDFAEQQHPDGSTFTYGPGHGKGGSYIDYMTVNFPHDFHSPVSGTKYFAGTFSLAQTFTKLGVGNYTVWQYYVRNKSGAPVKPGETFEIPFGQAKIVEDEYTVIWRLVEICKAIPRPIVVPNAIPAVQVPVATQVIPHIPDGGPVMNARFAKIVGMPADKAKSP